MNIETYKEKLQEIRQEAEAAKLKLAGEYFMSNSEIRKGDIITDHSMTIMVKDIKIVRKPLGSNTPGAIFTGPRLTKKMRPFLTGEEGWVFSGNVVEIKRQGV